MKAPRIVLTLALAVAGLLILCMIGLIVIGRNLTASSSERHVSDRRPEPKSQNVPGMMSKAESEIRRGDLDGGMDTLNEIVRDHPQSDDAQTIILLIRLSRQKGSMPDSEPVSSCKFSDALNIKKLFDALETVRQQYQSANRTKRESLEVIFGSSTFSKSDLSLDDLLNATQRMESARQKALNGE